MEKLKVISQKYNDTDVLELTEEEVSTIVKKYQNQPIIEAPEDEDDFRKYIGKCFIFNEVVYYPLYQDEGKWFYLTDDGIITMVDLDDENIVHEYEDYDLNAITYVDANPTLAGTESVLTGLQVRNTKYKNTVLYRHEIEFNQDPDTYIVIICSSDKIFESTDNLTTKLSKISIMCSPSGKAVRCDVYNAGNLSSLVGYCICTRSTSNSLEFCGTYFDGPMIAEEGIYNITDLEDTVTLL